jgi:hypothetical protein
MQACAAGYATTPKLQLVTRSVVVLTAARFKPLILPKMASPCSVPRTFGSEYFLI